MNNHLETLEELYRLVSKKLASEWSRQSGGGITSSLAHVLERLEVDGPLKISELAHSLTITLSAVTGISDKLISSGFASRKRTDEDRRVVYLEITGDGKEALERYKVKRKEILQKMFYNLTDEEVQQLIVIYRKILLQLDMDRGEREG